MRLPRMIDIERHYPASRSWDFHKELSRQFAESGALSQLKPGARVAVAVGSRGITNLCEIVAAVIGELRRAGAEPFVMPAMGSHGGATPGGQTQVLAEYGITSQSLGVSIEAQMEVRRIGTSENGVEVFISEAAWAADGIVVINRIKPHTDFSGSVGSGILKMIAIGLGKQRGAAACHAAATHLGHEAVIRAVAKTTLGTGRVLCAVAIVEDQNHQTADMRVLRPERIVEEEEKLFVKASSLMPALPLEEVDLLIVDFIGKDISGAGMDPNIIGRSVHGYVSSLRANGGGKKRVSRIFVRDLTSATNGNAIGIGLADFTTTRAVQHANWSVTYTNSLTAITPATAKIPIHFETDEECISQALASLALSSPSSARILRIANTLSLAQLQASEAYLEEISARTDLTVVRPAHEMEFDHEHNLLPLLFSGAREN
jgi:Lactate racemase N-terminal domain